MSYKNCEQYSTLESLKKRQEELRKEGLEILKALASGHKYFERAREVLRQKEEVVVAIRDRLEKHCSQCYNAPCPYYMEGVKIRSRR